MMAMSMGTWYGIGLVLLNGALCLAIPSWVLRWQRSMAQRHERDRRLAQATHRDQTQIADSGADRLAEVPVEAR
jgi:hypothetical protein